LETVTLGTFKENYGFKLQKFKEKEIKQVGKVLEICVRKRERKKKKEREREKERENV
jgi:hypothetical protein